MKSYLDEKRLKLYANHRYLVTRKTQTFALKRSVHTIPMKFLAKMWSQVEKFEIRIFCYGMCVKIETVVNVIEKKIAYRF